ncbi:MAG: hypothetical protein COA67_08615 [Lutibacter sp.]|nr:MAG: hypothetical protein COA67_08615 [Lutibacter sp.]
MEQGEEYDLLFQAHSPAALDEFVRHMPRGVEVRDVAMSLLGRHNGSDMTIRLEKPKGYARDVADAVKWKVSSWSSLEKPSLAKKPQPQPSDSTQQPVDAAAGATASTSEPKPTSSAASEIEQQRRTAGLSASLHSIADDRASITSAKTDGSVKVGQLMRLESSRSAMQQHLASLSIVSDEEDTELDGDGEDDGGDTEDGGNNITAGSPIGRLMRSSFRQYAKDDTDGASFPPSDEDDEGTSLMQAQDVLGDDDDDDDMNVDFGAVHVKPLPAAAAAQTLDGGAPLPFAVRGLGQPTSPASTAGSLTAAVNDSGQYQTSPQLRMEPVLLFLYFQTS